MSFFDRDDNVLDKYNEICAKIKEKLNIKFHNQPVYDQKYLKAKVREFDGVSKKYQRKIHIILALLA